MTTNDIVQQGIRDAYWAEQKRIADDVLAANLIAEEFTTSVELAVRPPADIELTGETRVRLTRVRASVTRWNKPGSTEDDDGTPYVRVDGLCHELTRKGEPDQRQEAMWRALPAELAAVLIGRGLVA